MMKGLDCQLLCYILGAVIVLMLVRAYFNEGKLWGEEEFYTVAMPKSPLGSGPVAGQKVSAPKVGTFTGLKRK